MSIVTLCTLYQHFTNFPLRMHQNASQKAEISKFSWGSMPPDPLGGGLRPHFKPHTKLFGPPFSISIPPPMPCDLHNEHVNCVFKEIIGNMCSNFTQEASTKAARAVSSLAKMAKRFDDQTTIHPQATAHTRKSDDKDLNLVVKVVIDSKCLQKIHNRCHSNFPGMKLNPLHKFKRDEFDLWVKSKMKQYDKYNGHDVTLASIVPFGLSIHSSNDHHIRYTLRGGVPRTGYTLRVVLRILTTTGSISWHPVDG